MSQPEATHPPGPMPASATIYLIRHAEKPDSGKGLSAAGQARAQAYVQFFQSLRGPTRQTLTWQYLFASTDSDHSDRPVLTITPLAHALNKGIDQDYADAHYHRLVDHLQKHAADHYANTNILICWHHGQILELAAALGASPKSLPATSNWPATWPGSEFGWLLQIYYNAEGSVDTTATQAISERLMPDDTTEPVYNG